MGSREAHSPCPSRDTWILQPGEPFLSSLHGLMEGPPPLAGGSFLEEGAPLYLLTYPRPSRAQHAGSAGGNQRIKELAFPSAFWGTLSWLLPLGDPSQYSSYPHLAWRFSRSKWGKASLKCVHLFIQQTLLRAPDEPDARVSRAGNT